MFRKVIPVLLVLGLTACSFNVNLPVVQTVGPTVTDKIALPLPADTTKTVDVSLEFGAGTLKLHPGAEALISGTATYNIPAFKPDVTSVGSAVKIAQGKWSVNGIPNWNQIKNEWDLSLGSVPINLSIKAGAYHAEYEFGGLALTNLTVQDGAADAKLNFSTPNAAEMALLRYETGASNVSLTGLANANFSSMEFDSGAGNYTLDFGGKLARNASVYVKTGVSNMTLVIPQGLQVQITVEGGLSNVSRGSGWSRNGNVYTQTGEGPSLTIVIEIGAGNLSITE